MTINFNAEGHIETTFEAYERAIQKLADGQVGRLYRILVKEKPAPECVNTILCLCNKRSCLGFTPKQETFIRKLRALS
jgi:hypothetical protein